MKTADYFSNLRFSFGRFFASLGDFILSIGGRKPFSILSDLADNTYVGIPQDIIDEAVVLLTISMEEENINRNTYKAERPDCDDVSLWQRNELNWNILPSLFKKYNIDATGKAFRIGEYSFRRADNHQRHRVCFLENQKGRRTYLDTYSGIVGNDGIVRTLNDYERGNGYEIG